MKQSGRGADNSFGPPLGQRPVWDTNGPDHDCDCPGPPPRFHLPPPPRPSSLPDSDCSDVSTSSSETCKALPVIDSEYRYSPVIPSVAVILTTGAAVMAFLFIGTFLVLLKKRKMRNLFPRKASLRNRCERTSANGVIYEDLANIRGRRVPPGCPLGQTRLPSIEMIDVASYADGPRSLAPALVGPAAAPVDPYNSQDLFNPVYEELSNGSGEQGESNSEGMVRTGASDEEFAEDELSLGGEGEERGGREPARDVDSSDADDRSKFIEKLGRGCREKERKMGRGPHGGTRRARTLDRRKMWRNKPPPPPPPPPPPLFTPPADCSELSQGFLLRRILQMYPDVTGVTLQYPRGSAGIHLSEDPSPDGNDYESLPGLAFTQPRRPKPDIFSTFGNTNNSLKSHSQDSAPGSDSGYSNNTSGGGGGGGGGGRPLQATRAGSGLADGGGGGVVLS